MLKIILIISLSIFSLPAFSQSSDPDSSQVTGEVGRNKDRKSSQQDSDKSSSKGFNEADDRSSTSVWPDGGSYEEGAGPLGLFSYGEAVVALSSLRSYMQSLSAEEAKSFVNSIQLSQPGVVAGAASLMVAAAVVASRFHPARVVAGLALGVSAGAYAEEDVAVLYDDKAFGKNPSLFLTKKELSTGELVAFAFNYGQLGTLEDLLFAAADQVCHDEQTNLDALKFCYSL